MVNGLIIAILYAINVSHHEEINGQNDTLVLFICNREHVQANWAQNYNDSLKLTTSTTQVKY